MRFYDHYTYRGKKIGAHAHPHGGRKKGSGSGSKSGLGKQFNAGKKSSAGSGGPKRPSGQRYSAGVAADRGPGVTPKGGSGNRDRGMKDPRKMSDLEFEVHLKSMKGAVLDAQFNQGRSNSAGVRANREALKHQAKLRAIRFSGSDPSWYGL